MAPVFAHQRRYLPAEFLRRCRVIDGEMVLHCFERGRYILAADRLNQQLVPPGIPFPFEQ